ncbi:MAG: AMP-binding protein [Flammeovirgaceae bacterium]
MPDTALFFSVSIAGVTYTRDAILKAKQLPHSALRFCRDWFLGKEQFVQQTSGSTGTPKLIHIDRQQMQASAVATIKTLKLREGIKALVCINTNYIGGKMMLVRGMIGNWQLTLVEPTSNPFQSLESSKSFDFTALVPLQLHAIMEQQQTSKLNGMKAIIVGGAPVSQQLQKRIQKVTVPIYSTYGMTETVSHIALKCLNGVNKTSNYHVLQGVEIGQDARGCLTIQGAMTGGRRLITNDLVEMYSPSEFKWLGRFDHVINSGGIKIPLEQLEIKIANLLTTLGVKSAFAVVPLPDERLGQRITLVFEEGQSNNPEIITAELKDKLAKYECPKAVIMIKKIPETKSGKIDRQQLLAEVLKMP